MRGWQIRPSTFFGLVFVSTLIMIPLPGPGLIIPFVSIPLFTYLRKQNKIKSFELLDLPLILLYMAGGVVGLIYLQMLSLVSVPWFKIIIVGMAADVVASLLGAFPVLGDAASAAINMLLALTVIGGIEGAIIGMALMIISMIPGPSLGANTFFIIIFKIISEILIGG